MYGCESWTIKKAEHWNRNAFELWCWRKLLRVLWTTRRSNQPILKEVIPEYSLEGLMLKVKLQYFGHLIQRASSLEKTLMLGKTEDRRRRGQQRMRWFDGVTDWLEFEQTPRHNEGQESLACCSHAGAKNWTWLNDWTATKALNRTVHLHCCPPQMLGNVDLDFQASLNSEQREMAGHLVMNPAFWSRPCPRYPSQLTSQNQKSCLSKTWTRRCSGMSPHLWGFPQKVLVSGRDWVKVLEAEWQTWITFVNHSLLWQNSHNIKFTILTKVSASVALRS